MRPTSPAFRAGAGGATLLMLAGCGGELSSLDPAGPAARDVATLWWVMLAGASVLFLLVMGLLYLAMRPAGALARHGTRTWLGLGGLVLPVLVLAALVAYALLLGERHLPRPLPDGPVRVTAQAGQWYWRFAHPDRPDVAPSQTLHIPAGEPVDVIVTTDDVIHSFWVPRLAGKIDAIPGHENRVRIQADRPGTYRGVCAEFCGTRHADMYFEIVAHDPRDWSAAAWESEE